MQTSWRSKTLLAVDHNQDVIGEICCILNTREQNAHDYHGDILKNVAVATSNAIIGMDQNFRVLEIASYSNAFQLLKEFLSHQFLQGLMSGSLIFLVNSDNIGHQISSQGKLIIYADGLTCFSKIISQSSVGI